MNLKKAFGRIIPLCLASLLLAACVLSIANDMYAFVKAEESFVLRVSDGTDSKTLAATLHGNGIIKNPTVFSLYVRSKGKEEKLASISGEWSLNAKMSYRELINEIFSKK